jgi:CRISPR system Cascade subunit CasB
LLEPAAIQLAQRLGILSSRSSPDDSRLEAALGLARVLAHVKEHDGARRVMQAAGWKSFPNDRKESEAGNDRPIVSEVRFRRLLTTEPGEPLVQAFIRLVRQLDSQVNVTELASDFLALSDPAKRQRVRTKWAFDYFAAGVAAPAVSEIPSDDEDEP